jgi:hypothetical protein
MMAHMSYEQENNGLTDNHSFQKMQTSGNHWFID